MTPEQQAAIREIAAHLKALEAVGLCVAPIKPTKEMLVVGEQQQDTDVIVGRSLATKVYRVMISARPRWAAPPTEPGEQAALRAAHQAGVRAGREQMREEAAREAETHTRIHTASITIAEAIRTLTLDPPHPSAIEADPT